MAQGYGMNAREQAAYIEVIAGDPHLARAITALPGVAAEVCEATAAISVPPSPRLNVGEVCRLASTVRNIIALLQAEHAQVATRMDVEIALVSLGYELESYRGYPAISLDLANPLLEVMNVGALLTQHEPRMYESVSQAVRWDAAAKVMWFEVEKSQGGDE